MLTGGHGQVSAHFLKIFKPIETYLYNNRKTTGRMKNAKTTNRQITTGPFILVLIMAIAFAAGCNPQSSEANVTISPEPSSGEAGINPITGEPYQDIVEKRGVKTNITDYKELVRRASSINEYKYNITDTGTGVKDQRFIIKGRFVKKVLPEPMQHSTGQVFDEILMDRITRQAFSHCSKHLCPKPDIDKELERVDYEDYYVPDPMEYLYKATDGELVREDMIGNQYTKVFSVTFEGKPARIWLQEYYGFPLKIIVRNEDDSRRTILFEDMMIDATRRGEIDTPFNFTISGEDGHWWFWEHYLGEWKPTQLTEKERAALGV